MPVELDTPTSGSRRNLSKKEEGGGGILSKFGTLTRRKKSLPPEENTPEGGATTPRTPGEAEAEEAELVEREGRNAIESCLFLPQPDLR